MLTHAVYDDPKVTLKPGFPFEQPSRTINHRNRWGTECASVLQLVKGRGGESEAHYAEK